MQQKQSCTEKKRKQEEKKISRENLKTVAAQLDLHI